MMDGLINRIVSNRLTGQWGVIYYPYNGNRVKVLTKKYPYSFLKNTKPYSISIWAKSCSIPQDIQSWVEKNRDKLV